MHQLKKLKNHFRLQSEVKHKYGVCLPDSYWFGHPDQYISNTSTSLTHVLFVFQMYRMISANFSMRYVPEVMHLFLVYVTLKYKIPHIHHQIYERVYLLS